ncbi:imm11 family protein [Chryseolinea lacunae]|uniref:Immunity MXAN-0049 protein domain-containing protein n=1 Tax=Chryseolinea lacunae TaxID=2801331 RepID=A0ABS1L077_9BACT|nr:DUF1629 domain-containing protein [Chryseolinea lacunae]MBL0745089.1 hypothetical protein [Chryseolinea lacunae]
MKYFALRGESNPKMIGVKNGVAQVEIDESLFENKKMYSSIRSFFDAFAYWEKTSFYPELDFQVEAARMLPHAKLTDFLSFKPFLISCPFMVNERIKSLLSKHNLQEHYYFPVRVFEKETLRDGNYYLFYSPMQDYDVIDFSKSTFFSGSTISGKQYFRFGDKDEFLKAMESNPLLTGEKLVLNRDFDKTLDLFNPRFGPVCISEKLKDALQTMDATGINVIDGVDPKIEVQVV